MNIPQPATQLPSNHQMDDKTRVAAAATPQTRMSNVVIAPDVDWADGLVEVDKGTELELSSVEVVTPVIVALSVFLASVLLLAVTANVLEFAPMVADVDIELTKDGAATALEGSTSAPFPQ